ncbi:hypothetical protein ACLOJK_040117 [Asimina triloba]
MQRPKPREETIVLIPGCTAHLIEDGESAELAKGDFALIRLIEDNVILATVVRVGADLQWPLTKDEPVVKVDGLHYLFSLPCEDGEIFSYGVSFSQPNNGFAALDSFLQENSCFSLPSAPNSTTSIPISSVSRGLDWKDYAPRIEDYNGVLARAIAGGTGEIVKGIFKCTNAYTKQVQNGGEMIRAVPVGDKSRGPGADGSKSSKSRAGEKKSGVMKGIKRVRMMSKMTERISKSMLSGVNLATGSVVAPLVKSKAGKSFLAMVPGEVLIASLDALDKIMDAVEAAEKEAFTATSGAAKTMVTNRYGESAGEVTEDVFTTAGHVVGTAWNIFKMRKAINPKSSLTSAIVKNAAKKKN